MILAGERYVLLPEAEYRRLRADQLPALPGPDADGHYQAAETIQVMIARNLIRRRQAARLTQAALAKRAGIRPETVHRLEQGKHAPTVATVDKIEKALKAAGV